MGAECCLFAFFCVFCADWAALGVEITKTIAFFLQDIPQMR